MAISTGAAILGGSLVSGVLGSKASKKAAQTTSDASAYAAELQLEAAEKSIAEQRRQFDIVNQQAQPYRQTAERSLSRLEDLVAAPRDFQFDLETSPAYQFRLEEGTKALDRSLVGSRLSGRAAKEAQRFGQGLASEEYGAEYARQYNQYLNQENRLFSTLSQLAGLGPSTIGAGLPTGIPSTIEAGARGAAGAYQTGATQAAGYNYAGAESINQAIQGGLSNWMTYNTMQAPSSGYTPYNWGLSEIGV